MAVLRASEKRKQYEEKYKEQRSRSWEGVNQQLNHLQQHYGVAVTELAEGLGVSRQKFYDFRAAPEKGLPIDRTDLVILWEWLTDPEAIEGRRLSGETKRKRELLRQEGPDPLLQATGFLPLSRREIPEDDQDELSKIDSGLKRVEARLNSPWIENGIRRAQIIDSLLDAVKNQGRLDKTLHSVSISAAEALTWIEDAPLYITDRALIHEYQTKIHRLARLGKRQFVGVELFELYQNLLEYLSIDNYSGAKIEIVDCQFPILSAPLPASVQESFEIFSSTYREAEMALLSLLCNLQEFDLRKTNITLKPETLFTPVVRAAITGWVEGYQKPITWRYSSTGTHLENMLSAITYGLGHSLDITGFSVQATGATSKSLARVSIGLAERDEDGNIGKVYQGWWVDSNAITAVLVATVIATKDWLSSHGADLSKYFNICHRLGDIDNKLYLIRENVQEYFFRAASSYSQNLTQQDNDSIFADIDSQISDLENLLSSDQKTQSCYRTRYQALENRRIKMKLVRTRLALKNSSVEKANLDISDIKSFLSTYEHAGLIDKEDKSEEEAYRHILFLQASECVMLHNFYGGDKEFLNGKLWRYRSRYGYKDGLKKLGKYIQFVGSLNFNSFSVASQLFGAIGLLELYMAEEKDADFLREAAQHLLWAAHYSQRIGYVRRAAYWLTHASRVYCRLKDFERSERLSKIAQVSAEAVHQTHQEEPEYDSKFKSFITATNHLTEGERLLVRGESKDAISSFLKALTIFVDIHSADRLTADVLYGLYQSSRDVDDEVGNVFAALRDNGKHAQLDPGMFSVLQNIIHSLKQIKPERSWNSASSEFKELAKKIWRYWVDTGNDSSEIHPIEESIERNRFLTPISSY